MLKNKKKLEEAAVVVGGGATGPSSVPGPIVSGSTKRPQDNKKGGETIDTSGADGSETPTENNVQATMNNAANVASIKAKPSAAGMKEETAPSYSSAELFEAFGMEDITEEFKTKISTIFEAAIAAQLTEKVAELEAVAEEKAEADLADLNELIDKYLSYAATEWLKENKLEVQHSLRTEITETFINGLKKLFVENYMDIPEEKADLVAEMTAEIETLRAALNEKTEEVIELSTVVTESVKNEIVDSLAESLAATQQAKLKTLSESVDFVNAEDFKKKVTVLKESFFKTTTPPIKESNLIVEDADDVHVETFIAKGPMSDYINAISRTSKL